ncbi:MAG: tellurite resistance protein TerC [Acidobacteriota bacterium]|jgi:tellurite resistance protein TerC|nr:tellurite resistance protein TerC [Acidobacteriota bacterium]
MEQIGTPLQWGVFFTLVAIMLALDLGVFHRKERRITLRESLFWSVFWTILALLFNYWIYYQFGSEPGIEFLTGYVIERSLSFDNIFVFIVIFNYFAVPAQYQHRVLFWGILGALISRGVFIAMGAALIQRFEWMIFVFGAFLVYTGIKILIQKETEVHPEKNPVVKLFQRFVPLTTRYHGKRFFAMENGRRVATPLMLVLVVIEATDIVFAVDSIPAIFAITRNGFIIFTSNIFAILGLRALYFLLAGLMHKFRYLGFGLGLVLAFIGGKMLTHRWVHIPTSWSLGVVLGILIVAVVASLLRPMDPGEVVDPTALQEKIEAD